MLVSSAALDADTIALLGQPTGGRTVVTLAPECATPAQIQQLVERGVIVSLGHTNATAADAIAAFDAGATGVTHLYNAMSQLQGRAPGVVGASLLDPRPWCGLIVDGHHVDPLALRVALAARPHTAVPVRHRCDAVCRQRSDVILTARAHQFTVADGVCRGEDGTLAGSAADMLTCVRISRTKRCRYHWRPSFGWRVSTLPTSSA
jgi:N-acetylglucosamine-6-phosphate deacetylase